MAKTQIHNYVFKPGIGLLDNLYPNAWNLLTKNKNFLLSEYKEYLNTQIADAEINRRDVGLIIDGAAFDVALDTTYNAVFFKNTRNYLIAHNTTMGRNNTRIKNKILTLSDVSTSSIATSRINTYFTSLSSTILNGKDDNDSISFTNPNSAPAVNIAAKDQLIANKNFIAEEINAYITANNPNDQHDDVGCKRDIKFVINALAYDVLYGGSSGVNSATFDLAKYCFYNFDTGSSNILPIHRTAAIAAFTRFSNIVDDIVKGVSITVTSGHSATQDTSSAATSEVISSYLVTLVDYIKDIISATNLSAATTALNNLTRTTPTISLWANTELQNANTTINNNRTNILDTETWLTDYIYTNTEINSKIDTALDILVFNFRYGGNESLLNFAQKYWDGSVSQVVGNRVPESDVYSWIGETVTNNIFTNTTYSYTGSVGQTIDTSYTAESDAANIFSGYVQNIVDTVFKGLDNAPTLILDGVGYVKLPIDYNISDFLIITNLKDNSVIYNFTNNQTGGKVSKTTPLTDIDFPTFVENSSTITKLELNYNTNSQTATDQLQIFVENTENNESVLFTTPSGIGQDIVGKARISQATTIDQTDFEYGMQEEKWNNVSLQQSYPSIYEKSQIPIQTTSITTDVSINSDKIGSSLITVNTLKPHNLIVGDAVNVNYLTNTITNTGAAEGTFIINSVPTTTSFAYYAKSKVGNDTEATNTNNYSTDFTVISDSGFLYVNGQTQWNRTIIAGVPTVYNTQIRYNGVVIVDTNDDTFFQQGFYQLGNDRYLFGTVTASAFETTSHQVKKQVLYSYLNIAVPQTIVKKSDFFTGGNLENMTIAVDSVGAETTSTSSLITPIGNRHYPFTGTTPTLGAPANVYYATNQLSATITTTSGSAIITTTDTSNLSVGAQVSATGIASNSIVKIIGTTGPNYSITLSKNATASGSSVSATITPKTVIGQVTSLQTTGSSGGIYVNPVLTKDAAIGNTKLTFSDTSGIITDLALDRGDGKAIFVQSIDGNDVNLSAPITTALTGNQVTYTNIKGTNVQHNGIGAIFNVAASGTSYSITISTAGQDYAIGDRLKILGTTIGGLSPANDLFIIVDTINGSGGITTATPSGTPFNGSATISEVSGILNGGSGTSATFDVTYLDNVYTNVVVNQNGSGYTVNDKIVIVGNSFTGGVTYTNDLVITVTGVDGSGAITAITSTGVAPNSSVSFTNPAFTTSGSGTASSFVVQNTAGVYSVTFTTTNNFNVADTIIIQGSDLGGQNTTNNLTISVSTVDATGAILTFSTLGSGINGTTVTGKSGTNLTGTGSKFTVSMTAGSYTNPIITNTGSDFAVGQIIKILGTSLMGSTPANDLLLIVNSVNSSRQLTGVSVQSGTAITAITSYNTVATVNDTITGTGAKFTITRTATAYSAIVERSGQNYAVGNKIKINGAHLGGSSTTHDLILRVISITAGGGIVLNSTAALHQTYSAVATGSTLNFLSTFTTSESLITELPTSSTINFDKLTSFIGTTETPHGLIPGNSIVNFSKSHTSSNKHDLSTLTTNVYNVPTDKTFKYFARTTGTVDESLTFPDQITTRYNNTTDFYKESVVNFGGSTTNQIEIKWDGQTILLVNQLQNTTVYNGVINNNYEYTLNGIKYKRGSSQVTGANLTEYQVQQIVPVKTFGDPINGRLFVKNNSTFSHIAQSSSVTISTGGPEYGAQAIRQTKDYFKYQPGKSMFFNTAVLFAPNYSVRNITSEATSIDSIITVTVDNRMHGLQKGCTVRISGISAQGYDSGPDTGVDNESDYKVIEIVDDITFTIKAIRPLGSTTPIIDSTTKISVVKWNGASVRTGIYTDQDGVFWEYDGDKLVTTLRSSTNPLTGSVNINKKTSTVTGTNTKFTDQLCAGDSVVIKGMTHTVSAVSSDTEFSVSPQWRGINNLVDEKIYKIVDHRVTQNNFNIDKLDGTGPSGYNVDISQIQMIAMQYNWNGGGSVEYLIQGVDGTYITVHRTRNANIKSQVYMRTANLPVRYESINIGPRSKLTSAITNSATSVVVNNSADFPSTGVLLIDNELIEYRSNNTTTNTLSNCVRAAKLKYYHAGSLRAYTGSTAVAHTAKTGVRFVSQTAHPILNHWTSNYQVDGDYEVNSNKFCYNITTQQIDASVDSNFMIRLAPSLSNNLVGDIGERNLVNYNKIKLDSIEVQVKDLYPTPEVITGTITATNSNGNITASVAHNLSINMPIKFSGVSPSATSMGGIQADGTVYYVKRIVNSTEFRLGASATATTEITLTTDTTDFINFETVPDLPGSIVIEGMLNPTNYPEVDSKISWTNLNGVAEGSQKSVSQIAFAQNIDWRNNLTTASTVTVVTAAATLTTGAGSAGFVYTTAQSTKNSPIAIASSQIRSLGPVPVGAKIISQNPDAFSNTTTEFYVKYITSDSDNTYLHYESIDPANNRGLSKQLLDHTSTPATTFKFEYDNYIGTRTNKLLFLKTAWDTGTRKIGDKISQTDSNWPIGTIITNVQLLKLKNIEFYEVTFNQDSIQNIAADTSIIFETGTATYAKGGETIFKGTTIPGEKLHLDLSGCKPLFNSPIGSNRTYPDGPDILVINTNKQLESNRFQTSGKEVIANITLNWKEI